MLLMLVLNACSCFRSAQLSTFNMGKCHRNKIVIILLLLMGVSLNYLAVPTAVNILDVLERIEIHFWPKH